VSSQVSWASLEIIICEAYNSRKFKFNQLVSWHNKYQRAASG